MSENNLFSALNSVETQLAIKVLSAARSAAGATDPVEVQAVREVLRLSSDHGSFSERSEEAALINAICRLRPPLTLSDAVAALQADVAIQRMGRQRLEDIFRRRDETIFDPRDVRLTFGCLSGVSNLRSTPDALALQRGRYQDLSPALAAIVLGVVRVYGINDLFPGDACATAVPMQASEER